MEAPRQLSASLETLALSVALDADGADESAVFSTFV